MLYSLKGRLIHMEASGIAVECAGVAYFCQTSLATLSAAGDIGSEIMVYTYMSVRDNAVDLYGFLNTAELSCFKMLTSVTGIGPKAALSILSQFTPDRIALIVASGDYKTLTTCPGVGAKTAQRIVLELKDKVKNIDTSGSSVDISPNINFGTGNMAEAINALVVLGYSNTEAASAVASCPPDMPAPDMIKSALKALGKK